MATRIGLCPNSGPGRGHVKFVIVTPLTLHAISTAAAHKFRRNPPCRLFATADTAVFKVGTEISEANVALLANDMALTVAFKNEDFVFKDGRVAGSATKSKIVIPPLPVHGCDALSEEDDAPSDHDSDVPDDGSVPSGVATTNSSEVQLTGYVESNTTAANDESIFPYLEGNMLPAIRAAIAGSDVFVERRREDGFIAFDYHPEHACHASFPDPMLLKGQARTASQLRRECRGLLLHGVTGVVVARRFPKFFNLFEREETLALVQARAAELLFTEKIDGSLCSPVVLDNDRVGWATKTAICRPLEEFVATRPAWAAFARHWLQLACTPLLEWCEAGKTPGVMAASVSSLTVLAVRHNRNGSFVDRAVLARSAVSFGVMLVPCLAVVEFGLGMDATLGDVAAVVRDDVLREGVVAHFPRTGLMVKLKTLWYVALAASSKVGGGRGAFLGNLLQQRGSLTDVPADVVWTACLAADADDAVALCAGLLRAAGMWQHATALAAFHRALQQKLQNVTHELLAWGQEVSSGSQLLPKERFQVAIHAAHEAGWPAALASACLRANAAQSAMEVLRYVRKHALAGHVAQLGSMLGLVWDVDDWAAAVPETDSSEMVVAQTCESLADFQVYCDLDGVLADFSKGVAELTGRSLASLSPDALWKQIMTVGDFFLQLDMCEGAAELWAAISKFGNGIPAILTGLPDGKFGKKVRKHKQAWCEKNLLGSPAVHTCKTADKHTFSNPRAILIDDRLELKEAWQARGGIFVHHRSVLQTVAHLSVLADPTAEDKAVAAVVSCWSASVLKGLWEDPPMVLTSPDASDNVLRRILGGTDQGATVAVGLVVAAAHTLYIAAASTLCAVSLRTASPQCCALVIALLAHPRVVKVVGFSLQTAALADLCQQLVQMSGSPYNTNLSVESVVDLEFCLPDAVVDDIVDILADNEHDLARLAPLLVRIYAHILPPSPWWLCQIGVVPNVLVAQWLARPPPPSRFQREFGLRTLRGGRGGYTAVTFDSDSRELLLRTFPAVFAQVLGTHVTLAFNPRSSHLRHLPPAGTACVVTIVGPACDDGHVQAVRVSSVSTAASGALLPAAVFDDRFLHVTLSVVPGVSAARANALWRQTADPLPDATSVCLAGIVSIHRSVDDVQGRLLLEEVTQGLAPSAAPVLCVLRGLPGSGKTTLAQSLCAAQESGAAAVHISADHFFERGAGMLSKRDAKGRAPLEVYASCFAVHRLPAAHSFAQEACATALAAMPAPVRLVVIDNCHVLVRDLVPYLQMACECAYAAAAALPPLRVLVVELPPPPADTPGAHNVPIADVHRMRSRWETAAKDVLQGALLVCL